MTSVVAPKIVGKALYLELVADPSLSSDKARSLLGWQHTGVKQLVIFPQYQDDTGKVYSPFVLSRVVSSYSPKAQWDSNYVDECVKKLELDSKSAEAHPNYVEFSEYTKAEWDLITEREKYESRKLALELTLKRHLIDTTYEGEGDERKVVAEQGWVVRNSKPIAVEVTDEDYKELIQYRKTPQAVIRRINKVRSMTPDFPEKLA